MPSNLLRQGFGLCVMVVVVIVFKQVNEVFYDKIIAYLNYYC